MDDLHAKAEAWDRVVAEAKKSYMTVTALGIAVRRIIAEAEATATHSSHAHTGQAGSGNR